MLNIRTRIRIDLNPFKQIWSRIRSENIRTVFIPIYMRFPKRGLQTAFTQTRTRDTGWENKHAHS
jgi:hypothetical protein